jgi:hypothetical protein
MNHARLALKPRSQLLSIVISEEIDPGHSDSAGVGA